MKIFEQDEWRHCLFQQIVSVKECENCSFIDKCKKIGGEKNENQQQNVRHDKTD